MTVNVPEDADAPGTSFPRCSSCGAPVAMETVTDPLESVASPCGCRLGRDSLDSE